MFARFVEAYQRMVLACCRAVGVREEDLEDAVAETFFAAYKSIRSYRGKSKLSSWLWKIAYCKAVNYRKRRHPAKGPDETKMETIAAAENLPETRLSDKEQNAAVWDAVALLSASQAAAIVLFYREAKTIEEISSILKKPVNTVKTDLRRGRKELYGRLHSIWKKNDV